MKTTQITQLPITSIIPDPFQPRKYFDAVKIASLAKSIAQIGIKEPLVVESQPDGTYKLIDGERRYRAAVLNKMKEVPAVVEAPMSEIQRMIEQFHIQEQHEGWRPQEKAIAIRDIAHAMGTTMKEIGNSLGLSERTVNTYMSFINLLVGKEMMESEISIDFSRRIESTTNRAIKELLIQEERDMTEAEKKGFQLGIIRRIKSGEVTKDRQLTKVLDALTQEAEKTVKDVIKTNNSLEKMFIDSKAQDAQMYRMFINDMHRCSRIANSVGKNGVVTQMVEADEKNKAIIRTMIKNLQAIVN